MTLVLFDFQKLEVYIKATALKSQLHLTIKGQYFDRSVYNQLQRASLSVILNIAEGSGRSKKMIVETFSLSPEHPYSNVLLFLIYYVKIITFQRNSMSYWFEMRVKYHGCFIP